VHGRTRVQMYKGDADWTLIGKIKENSRINIPIFGNGDIDSPEKALEYRNRFGVDGIMIGRASIGYPWIFNEIKHFMRTGQHLAPPTTAERVRACRKHLDFSIRWKGDRTGIVEMRRHYASYFKGLNNFKSFRMRLVETMSYQEINDILEEVTEVYSMEMA
jgi:tRNA-dihydrouridine synthase B